MTPFQAQAGPDPDQLGSASNEIVILTTKESSPTRPNTFDGR